MASGRHWRFPNPDIEEPTDGAWGRNGVRRPFGDLGSFEGL